MKKIILGVLLVILIAVGIFIFATMICIIVKQIMNKKAEAKELEE